MESLKAFFEFFLDGYGFRIFVVFAILALLFKGYLKKFFQWFGGWIEKIKLGKLEVEGGTGKNAKQIEANTQAIHELKCASAKPCADDIQVRHEELLKTLVEQSEKIKSMMEDNDKARVKRQIEVDARLDAQYAYIKEAALKAGLAVVFSTNPNTPADEQYEAGLLNILLGANGNLWPELVKIIMRTPDGVARWNTALNKFEHNYEKSLTAHFHKTVKEIKDSIR